MKYQNKVKDLKMIYRIIFLLISISISLDGLSQEDCIPEFDYSLKNVTDSNNLNVSFKIISECKYKSIYLNFGDGQYYECESTKKTKCDSIVYHKYKQPGKYLIYLCLGHEYKRRKQSFSSINQYIDVSYDTTYFYYRTKNVSCDEYCTIFSNKSTSYDSLIWSFGDGTFSNEDNPTHFFHYFKDYNVEL